MNNKLDVKFYDNGGETCDRYTMIIGEPCKRTGLSDSLGFASGGRGFSMWGECLDGEHLGKRVEFSSLDEDTKKHVLGRVEELREYDRTIKPNKPIILKEV